MDKSIITENIVSIANEKGYKLTTIADKCGYDLNKFSDMLNNRVPITSLDVDILSRALDVPPNGLLNKRSDGNKSARNIQERVTLLSVKDVCEQLGISRWTVTKLIDSGQLRASKIGGSYRFKQEDIDQLVSDSTVKVG